MGLPPLVHPRLAPGLGVLGAGLTCIVGWYIGRELARAAVFAEELEAAPARRAGPHGPRAVVGDASP